MSTVDVIVPCYNYAQFLPECVNSVLTQTGPSIRVLIINDASTDNTAKVADRLSKADSRVTVLHHAVNHGHIATYNEGIDWTAADFMLLLSADDYLLPGAFHRAISLMNTYPDIVFTFGAAVQMEPTGDRRLSGLSPMADAHLCPGRTDACVVTGEEFFRRTAGACIVTTATAIVRTACQKKAGGYSSELPHAGDMEMWMRLATQGSVGYISTPQAVYRKHGNNMSVAYLSKRLPDIEQREAVLSVFFSRYSGTLANSRFLRDRAMCSLSWQALMWADEAFEKGDPGHSRKLSAAARRIYPRSMSSGKSITLSVKQLLGLPLTQRVRSIIRRPAV